MSSNEIMDKVIELRNLVKKQKGKVTIMITLPEENISVSENEIISENKPKRSFFYRAFSWLDCFSIMPNTSYNDYVRSSKQYYNWTSSFRKKDKQ